MRCHVIMTAGRDARDPVEHVQFSLPSLLCTGSQVGVFAVKHIPQKVNSGADTSFAFLPTLISYQVDAL